MSTGVSTNRHADYGEGRRTCPERKRLSYWLNQGEFLNVGGALRTSANEASGGEGGIRTPDTVARMPHFECGAFNRSATSPKGAKGSRSNPYLAAAAQR